MAEAVSDKFTSSSGGSDSEESTLVLASTDAWGQADFTHWQPWQSSSSSYYLLPQAAVDWQGLPWRSLCSGSYLRPQESMAPQALGGKEGL